MAFQERQTVPFEKYVRTCKIPRRERRDYAEERIHKLEDDRRAPALQAMGRQTKVSKQPDATRLQSARNAADELRELFGRETVQEEMSGDRIVHCRAKVMLKDIGMNETNGSDTLRLPQHPRAAVQTCDIGAGTEANDCRQETTRTFTEEQDFSAVRNGVDMSRAA